MCVCTSESSKSNKKKDTKDVLVNGTGSIIMCLLFFVFVVPGVEPMALLILMASGNGDGREGAHADR